jgi:DNA-binding GntR family transcriptional regulator
MTVSQLSKTRHGQVYESLRGDILSGRITPGTKLPFAQLSERYGFSVGVIREALSRLVEQRLVENLPQQGFRVTSISKADLLALTQARCEIEALTLKHSMHEGDTSWQSEVLAAHFRLANTPSMDATDPDRLNEEWVEVHNTFHATLLEGCNNKRLTDICGQLRDSAELYRQWSARIGEAKKRDAAAEHQAITDAVLAGDSTLASRLLKEHIGMTTELLLESGFVEDV